MCGSNPLNLPTIAFFKCKQKKCFFSEPMLLLLVLAIRGFIW